MSVYCEVNSKLAIAHIIISPVKLQKFQHHKVNVHAEPTIITVTTHHDDNCKYYLSNFSILPETCHSLQLINNNELHMRLKAHVDRLQFQPANRQNGFCKNLKKVGFEPVVSPAGDGSTSQMPQCATSNLTNCEQSGGDACGKQLTEDVSSGDEDEASSLRHLAERSASCARLSISCAKCSNTIVNKGSIERLLPLPGDNWHEVSESWFCHKTSGDTLDQPSSTNPRGGDCLVMASGARILVSQPLIATNSVQAVHQRALKCTKCSSFLGSILNHNSQGNACSSDGASNFTVQLYSCMLSVETRPRSSSPIAKSPVDHIKHTLAHLRRRHMIFRVLIEARSPRGSLQPYVMLSLMDSHTSIAVGDYSPGGSCRLCPRQVLRVLYQDCLTGKSSLSTAWRRDMTVHNLELPLEACELLLSDLVKSTTTIPPSLRKANDNFWIGFIWR